MYERTVKYDFDSFGRLTEVSYYDSFHNTKYLMALSPFLCQLLTEEEEITDKKRTPIITIKSCYCYGCCCCIQRNFV